MLGTGDKALSLLMVRSLLGDSFIKLGLPRSYTSKAMVSNKQSYSGSFIFTLALGLGEETLLLIHNPKWAVILVC